MPRALTLSFIFLVGVLSIKARIAQNFIFFTCRLKLKNQEGCFLIFRQGASGCLPTTIGNSYAGFKFFYQQRQYTDCWM
jgi:hypothetical protein